MIDCPDVDVLEQIVVVTDLPLVERQLEVVIVNLLNHVIAVLPLLLLNLGDLLIFYTVFSFVL